MGHIQLSRDADLLLVAPTTADVMAKMAAGMAGDMATTALLATDKPVMIVPAMNVRMWEHAATQTNLKTLIERGVTVIGPDDGDMACGEFGPGRMTDPLDIVQAVADFFSASAVLASKHAIVTSGPTHEAIDPVRYIANRSSGKQGHAIAEALAALGAKVTLITGPVSLADPVGINTIHVQSARDMLAASQEALPADIAVCAAAVADWRVVDEASEKMKKDGSGQVPALNLTENPDILANLSKQSPDRPALVVGFAAETETIIEHARAKLARKGCDWIVANDVSPETGTFGGDMNTVHLVTEGGEDPWPRQAKTDIGRRLAQAIANHFSGPVDGAAIKPGQAAE